MKMELHLVLVREHKRKVSRGRFFYQGGKSFSSPSCLSVSRLREGPGRDIFLDGLALSGPFSWILTASFSFTLVLAQRGTRKEKRASQGLELFSVFGLLFLVLWSFCFLVSDLVL